MKGSRAGSFRGGGGGGEGGPQPTDLLVCFPTRSHLTLMPKPICSPSRSNTKSSPRAAHLFRTPTNTNTNTNRTRSQLGSEPMSEPTSPKVTCAGQIKVRTNKSRTIPKPKHNRNHNWIDSLGLKKDVMNFLGALRSLRFNMQCFGTFRGAVDCCSDEEEEDEEEEEEASRLQAKTVFSKWFMVLDENNDGDDDNEDHVEHEKAYREEEEEQEEEEAAQPPKNALMLMRCRSAPTKGLEVEEKEEEEGNKGGDEDRLMLMSYAPDFFKLSTEVAKETWVVGSFDPLARSRSWRR